MVNNSIYVEIFLFRLTAATVADQDVEFGDDAEAGDEFLTYLASVANIGNNHRYLVAIKKAQKRAGQQRGGPKVVLYDGDDMLAAEEVLKNVRQELRDHGYWNSESFTVPFPESAAVDDVLDTLFPSLN